MPSFPNKSLANAVTLCNIVFGSLSLVYTLDQQFGLAAIFILIAAVLDGLDGRIARRLDIMSPLGKELDSLCDMVSFGVAPALLIYAQVLINYTYSLGLITALLYIVCGAYRLARFNVLDISGYFLGIPITLAGTFLALLALFAAYLPAHLILALLLLMAIMMVSNIKIPKL
ncbi:CDP-diacylglycerol--serine O-phosphatidyltransferase [Syntrophomonas zehnderi OL-4]|uniref:CDP-diacylglycerol--serine O-phosphatidyltransferase n=1 Tax=Syntrophomonas zehnderi OL-4 TaxID=690567 RepID=A0A0E4GAT8_9FIRM|nr:CDP-diacylglycerol--serine O-phosphatidyltransferase [Syntrophomonas zehnderi]CFX44461.1 CDP-diacylglycerol--serine O-phosphatidyltransferase [Syntrophomonas zehnderi OL-4]